MQNGMSALPPKADIDRRFGNIRQVPIADIPRPMGARTDKCRSFDEWVRATNVNAMLLIEIPVSVNHGLILSSRLPSYHGALPPLAKLLGGET